MFAASGRPQERDVRWEGEYHLSSAAQDALLDLIFSELCPEPFGAG